MPWTKISVTKHCLRKGAYMAATVVDDFRNRGYSKEQAREFAAASLGVTPRRIKALLCDEAFTIETDDYKSMLARYLDHAEEEAAHLIARANAARGRLAQKEAFYDDLFANREDVQPGTTGGFSIRGFLRAG